MAVDVSATPVFRAGEPKRLFALTSSYSAAPDGERFLVGLPVSGGAEMAAEVPFTVILNWTTLLGER